MKKTPEFDVPITGPGYYPQAPKKDKPKPSVAREVLERISVHIRQHLEEYFQDSEVARSLDISLRDDFRFGRDLACRIRVHGNCFAYHASV